MLNRELQGLTPDEKRNMMLAYDLCGVEMSQKLDTQPVRGDPILVSRWKLELILLGLEKMPFLWCA